MIFWVHKKSANVQSLSNNYIFGNDMIFWISTIDKGIIAKAKKWRGILNHPFFSFLKTLFLNFFFCENPLCWIPAKIFWKKTLYKSYMLWSSHNLIHVYVSLWDVLTRLSILRLKFLSYIPPYSTPREISGEIHRF